MKKVTTFVRVQRFLSAYAYRGPHAFFRFKDLGAVLGMPYPSTAYTYLNLFRNAGIVKKVGRGQYVVPNEDRVLGVTLTDLTNRVQVKALRRKLREEMVAHWQAVRRNGELIRENKELKSKQEPADRSDRQQY